MLGHGSLPAARLPARGRRVRAATEQARTAYERALLLFGEEVHRLWIPDPVLSAFYLKLDKLARWRAGSSSLQTLDFGAGGR